MKAVYGIWLFLMGFRFRFKSHWVLDLLGCNENQCPLETFEVIGQISFKSISYQ